MKVNGIIRWLVLAFVGGLFFFGQLKPVSAGSCEDLDSGDWGIDCDVYYSFGYCISTYAPHTSCDCPAGDERIYCQVGSYSADCCYNDNCYGVKSCTETLHDDYLNGSDCECTYCGDNTCQSDESCSSCEDDCGACCNPNVCKANTTTYTQACGSTTRNYSCTNECGGTNTWKTYNNDCKECGPYLSAWTSCGADHKRTRTCSEDCGTGDCAAETLSEDCVGTITGTFFDASDVSDSCTAAEITASPKFGSQAFEIVPTPDIAKWPMIYPPVVTNVSGVYSESVYASAILPANYIFDYTNLFTSGVAAEVKTECGVSMAALTTQAQVVTKNTGFWRVYGGWWQVIGGSVYAASGLKSTIPASIDPMVSPFINQNLILPDANGDTGVLSHGFAWTGAELGTNPNAGVSEALFQARSEYKGVRFDYNYYNTRMDIFEFTPWSGGSISYDDGEEEYQIFKGSGPLSLNATTLSAGQKVIILVDGGVSVGGDIVVPDGAFLAVIAKNGITFSSSVSTAQGWFVAETITVSCNETAGVCDKTDIQFDGQGAFVGWTGIYLLRDRYTENNNTPSEKFTYRSDFFLNAPAPMKVYVRKFSPFIP